MSKIKNVLINKNSHYVTAHNVLQPKFGYSIYSASAKIDSVSAEDKLLSKYTRSSYYPFNDIELTPGEELFEISKETANQLILAWARHNCIPFKNFEKKLIEKN